MRYLHTPPLTITRSLKITPALWDKIERIAAVQMTSKSEVVRNALEDLRDPATDHRVAGDPCVVCGETPAPIHRVGGALCSACARAERASTPTAAARRPRSR